VYLFWIWVSLTGTNSSSIDRELLLLSVVLADFKYEIFFDFDGHSPVENVCCDVMFVLYRVKWIFGISVPSYTNSTHEM
jgi:hypothetical protein